MVDIVTHEEAVGKEGAVSSHKKTTGELVFDRVVYTGIGFGVNEAMSLWITDQFMHGKNLLHALPEPVKKVGSWFSAEGYSRLSDKIAESFKLAAKQGHKGVITPKARAGNGILMVTLLSGGTLLILPMKWLEDSRNYWVKKLNHWLDGGKLSPEEVAARDKDVEQSIACAPRQSWPSMLAGRVIACLSSVGTGTFLMGPERNERLMDGVQHGVAGTLEGAHIAVGGNGETMLGHLANRMKEKPPVNEKGEPQFNTLQRYARLIGVETYSCAISSIVLELASKFLSKKNSRVHDPELCHELKNGNGNSAPSNKNESDNDSKTVSKATREIQPASHVERIQSCQCNAQPSLGA